MTTKSLEAQSNEEATAPRSVAPALVFELISQTFRVIRWTIIAGSVVFLGSQIRDVLLAYAGTDTKLSLFLAALFEFNLYIAIYYLTLFSAGLVIFCERLLRKRQDREHEHSRAELLQVIDQRDEKIRELEGRIRPSPNQKLLPDGPALNQDTAESTGNLALGKIEEI